MTPNNPPPTAPVPWARVAAIWQAMIACAMVTNLLTAAIATALDLIGVVMLAMAACVVMVIYLFLIFGII